MSTIFIMSNAFYSRLGATRWDGKLQPETRLGADQGGETHGGRGWDQDSGRWTYETGTQEPQTGEYKCRTMNSTLKIHNDS